MRRKIPSTTALAAFESAARHQSFTIAGAELSLTQSAVGRQIANLEHFLGAKLFRRTRRGVALTEAGQAYSRTVRERLNDLERDALELMSHAGGASALEIGVVPTFATQWLIPRLPQFQQAHPQVTINLHSRARPFLFEEEKLDAAIYAGPAPWTGTAGIRLMPERLDVVCSPKLLGTRRRFSPSAVAALPLLQISTRPYAWRQWFQSHGVIADHSMTGPRFELFSMIVEAAIQGMGVALVPQFLVQDELKRGALISLFTNPFPSGRDYFLVFPEHAAEREPLSAFSAWLSREATLYETGGRTRWSKSD